MRVNINKKLQELQELQEELEFKSALLDSAMDSVFVHDLKGNIIYANKSAYQTRGYSREELLNIPLDKLTPAVYKKSLGAALKTLVEKGEVKFESGHLRKNSSIMPVEIHTRIMKIGNRKLGLGIIRDITERKKVETERKNVADILEDALFSVPKKIPGITFGHLYRSSSQISRVGGDFYDLFEVNSKIAIVVGDVSGKGLAAATLAAFIKTTIKAYAYLEKSAASIMQMTNETTIKTSTAGIFTTVFLGLLDKKTGQLNYCGAGHPGPIIKRGNGQIEILNPNSPVIGVFTNQKFVSKTKPLKPGDDLILYTDGATEAKRDNQLFGEERLIEIIKNLKLPVKDCPSEIFKEVVKFSQGKLFDDVVLLSVTLT